MALQKLMHARKLGGSSKFCSALSGHFISRVEPYLELQKMANAHDFISKFLEYRTHVGEPGIRLSEGQKQGVAIDRALLMDPNILLFDEATSALDVESEFIVHDAIDFLMKGRTVLVIAHHLSTVKSANIVAVVSDGQVVKTDNHDELLNKDGIYTALVRRKLQESKTKI